MGGSCPKEESGGRHNVWYEPPTYLPATWWRQTFVINGPLTFGGKEHAFETGNKMLRTTVLSLTSVCVWERGGEGGGAFSHRQCGWSASGNVFIVAQAKLPFFASSNFFLHLPECEWCTPRRDGQQVWCRVADQNFAKYPDCNIVKESTHWDKDCNCARRRQEGKILAANFELTGKIELLRPTFFLASAPLHC